MRYKLWKPEVESEIPEPFAELKYGDIVVEIATFFMENQGI